MTPIVVDSNQVIVGVDTHKDNHVAFAINSLGVRLEDCIVPATKRRIRAVVRLG